MKSLFKKIEIVTKHLLQPQCYETRYQLQEKKCKKHKHMEIKQDISTHNHQQVTEEIKKFLETNDDENMIIQNLWAVAKAVIREKFTTIQAYLKKQEKHRTDNLTLQLEQPEKEEPQQKFNRRKEKFISEQK